MFECKLVISSSNSQFWVQTHNFFSSNSKNIGKNLWVWAWVWMLRLGLRLEIYLMSDVDLFQTNINNYFHFLGNVMSWRHDQCLQERELYSSGRLRIDRKASHRQDQVLTSWLFPHWDSFRLYKKNYAITKFNDSDNLLIYSF